MSTKLIVTNGSALDAKYGDRAAEVWQAVDALIAADANRGITTSLVKLDDSTGPAGQDAVTATGDAAQAVAAANAVAAHEPDYMTLLGGPDVIPHCPLANLVRDDADTVVPSDLPYACNAALSSTIADFLAPTRCVTRLPDVP